MTIWTDNSAIVNRKFDFILAEQLQHGPHQLELVRVVLGCPLSLPAFQDSVCSIVLIAEPLNFNRSHVSLRAVGRQDFDRHIAVAARVISQDSWEQTGQVLVIDRKIGLFQRSGKGVLLGLGTVRVVLWRESKKLGLSSSALVKAKKFFFTIEESWIRHQLVIMVSMQTNTRKPKIIFFRCRSNFMLCKKSIQESANSTKRSFYSNKAKYVQWNFHLTFRFSTLQGCLILKSL